MVNKNYTEEVKNYFKDKASEYDLVDKQVYWVLSDNLLWHIWNNEVLNKINKPIRFLDAGGGTGRWSIKLLENYYDSSGEIIDMSPQMLDEAKKKIHLFNYDNRLKCCCDDLDGCVIKDKYNVIFSFHNVLGFVKSPENVIKKLVDSLEIGGYLVCVVPNYYHGIFFNLFNNNVKMAEKCYEESVGKFTSNMPDMRFFRPEEFKDWYEKFGLKIVGSYGFPISIYPGMQETQLRGQTQMLKDLLEDEENFQKIYEMEKVICMKPEAVARGNNLIFIGKKENVSYEDE